MTPEQPSFGPPSAESLPPEETHEEHLEIPQEERTEPVEDESSRRQRRTRHFVEAHVLGIDPLLDEPELQAEIHSGLKDLPLRDKANLLYEKIMARQSALKEASAEEIDPYLLGEIQALWADPQVQQVALDRYTEARMDTKIHRVSDLGKNWDAINIVIDAKQQQYEGLTRDLFLQKITREDKLSVARTRAATLAKQLIEKREERDDIVTLEGLPHIPENTDTAALIHYDRLKEMHDQAAETGFVWLPSREKIYHRTIGALQNGRWPVLKGEAGTGKSELADAAAYTLTGEEPTKVPCGPRTSERDLIMDKEIDPDTGGSYDGYKPLMQAATGFDDSRQTEPTVNQGRVMRLDEFNRLDQGGPAYSVLKEARQLRPGDKFHEKTVLPGFSAIGTANPPGPRYPDRSELDAAMRREVAEIEVDYPPMTAEEPEIYEFILATLMDKNGHIAVAREELAPFYKKEKVDPPRTMPNDERVVVGEETLLEDATSTDHGFAWRLSFAIRSIQDAFDYGNAQTVPSEALKFKLDAQGKGFIAAAGGEPLTLRSSTITLGEIASWMKGFQDRKQKDNEEFQTDTLAEWIQYKVDLYVEQSDIEDREKLRALFDYYNISEAAESFPESAPLTPKEIGYLSPRVPRPLELEELEEEQRETLPALDLKKEIPLHETNEKMLEDGTSILVKPRSYDIPHPERDIHLSPGAQFLFEGRPVAFVGVVEDEGHPEHSGELVLELDVDSGLRGLHRLVTEGEIIEYGEGFNMSIAEAQEVMGEANVRGPEVVERAFGVHVSEILPIPFSRQDLETAKRLGQVLEYRVDYLAGGEPLTLKNMKELIHPEMQRSGKGTLFYGQDWYNSEAFFTDETPRAGWALVSKEVIPGSLSKNYLQQTDVIAEHIVDAVFKGQELPPEYQEAVDEYASKRSAIESLMTSNWQEAAKQLSELKITKMTRQTAVEAMYDIALAHLGSEERMLETKYSWTNTRSSDGNLVLVGGFDSDGADVDDVHPGYSDGNLGVSFSRSL
jgi:MoxR-like ATPase